MDKAVEDLNQAEAADELARLAQVLAAANAAYHLRDAPEMSDAAYDALKRRNVAIEARFPALKRGDSPSEQVGGGVVRLDATAASPVDLGIDEVADRQGAPLDAAAVDEDTAVAAHGLDRNDHPVS
jgi:NAD-dependent DNA ligase